MSTQMPTLFDDDDYMVPQSDQDNNKSLPKEISEPESVDDQINLPDEQTAVLNIENSLRENELNPLEETVSMSEIEEKSLDTPVREIPESLTRPVMEMPEESVEEESNVEISASEDIENNEDTADIYAANAVPAASSIIFEIPEEEIVPEITVATIQEDPVDDLDKMIRTETILADYSSYMDNSSTDASEKNEDQENEDSDKEEANVEHPRQWSSSIEFVEEAKAKAAAEIITDNENALPEFQLEDKYYTIGEVAGMFGVNISHIRFWTTEFKMKVRTTRKGDRLYNKEDIAKLKLIHHLVKENKHTLKGAKEKLKQNKSAVNAQVDLKDKLQFLKGKLEMIKRNL